MPVNPDMEGLGGFGVDSVRGQWLCYREMMGISHGVLLWSASFWSKMNKTEPNQIVAALSNIVCPCDHLDDEYGRWY